MASGLTEAPARNETYAEWYRRTMPSGYQFARHVEFLCNIVQRVVDGDLQRVAISTPPGHAKSDTITRRLPNYWGPRHPNDAIVLTGYSQRFAEKNLSYPAREMAREAGVLSPDASAMDEWEFQNGARLIARGVGAAPTGINPISLLIADDPINSRAQAQSETERENIWQWWTGSIVQRFWPRTRAIVIATRWHEDDLIGKLRAQESGWAFINLPAIALEDDPMGRSPGEALWPEGKPLAFLQRIRAEIGEYEFEAVYQGNPTPREGSLFQVGKLGVVPAFPTGLPPGVLAWDLGAGENEGDWTAGVEMRGPDEDGIYFMDVVRFRHEPSGRNRRIRQEADLRKPRKVRVPQDPGAAGKESALTLVRLHAGHAVEAKPVSGDKALRAEPLAAQVNGGNVRVVDSPFARDLIEEFRQFPGGRHDDMVDAAADAFAEAATPSWTDWSQFNR